LGYCLGYCLGYFFQNLRALDGSDWLWQTLLYITLFISSSFSYPKDNTPDKPEAYEVDSLVMLKLPASKIALSPMLLTIINLKKLSLKCHAKNFKIL
jgi:hypothetical protein